MRKPKWPTESIIYPWLTMIGLLNLDSHMNKHYSNRMVVKRWGTEFNILLFSNIVMRITNSNL